MISKKMRNISMVCLSLVLALSLAFGLSSFSSIKKADAAENTVSDGVMTTTYTAYDSTEFTLTTVGTIAMMSNNYNTLTSSYAYSGTAPAYGFYGFKEFNKDSSATLIFTGTFDDVENVSFKAYGTNNNLKFSAYLVDANGSNKVTLAEGVGLGTSRKLTNYSYNVTSTEKKLSLKIYLYKSDTNTTKYTGGIADVVIKSAAPEIKEVKSLDAPTAVKKYAGDTYSLPSTFSGVVGENEKVNNIAVSWVSNNENITISGNIATINDKTPVGDYTVTATAVDSVFYAATNAPTTTLKIQVFEKGAVLFEPVIGGDTALDQENLYVSGATVSDSKISIPANTEAKILFYIDEFSYVTFSGSRGSSTKYYDFGSTKETNLVDNATISGAIKSNLQLSATKGNLYSGMLSPGVYLLVIRSSSSTAEISDFSISCTSVKDASYTFVGYNDNGTISNSGDVEQAIFAKADYLGASFKTTGASIRYGFILEIVNADDEALSDEVLKTLKSNVSGKFIFTTPKENTIIIDNFGAGTVTSNGEQKSGIVANLVITEMEETHYTAETTTSIELKINGYTLTANSGDAASAQACAQVAFNKDTIKADVAASFGVTSKTNIN